MLRIVRPIFNDKNIKYLKLSSLNMMKGGIPIHRHSLKKPIVQSRCLYTMPKITNKHNEYIQFAISGTNCLLVVSILGYYEQYNEKMKIIDSCNTKLSFIISNCISINNKNIEFTPIIVDDEKDH